MEVSGFGASGVSKTYGQRITQRIMTSIFCSLEGLWLGQWLRLVKSTTMTQDKRTTTKP